MQDDTHTKHIKPILYISLLYGAQSPIPKHPIWAGIKNIARADQLPEAESVSPLITHSRAAAASSRTGKQADKQACKHNTTSKEAIKQAVIRSQLNASHSKPSKQRGGESKLLQTTPAPFPPSIPRTSQFKEVGIEKKPPSKPSPVHLQCPPTQTPERPVTCWATRGASPHPLPQTDPVPSAIEGEERRKQAPRHEENPGIGKNENGI